MPRAEVGTPKYLANKMKAKGLQKLRWYCQMCQKQCRDENGFKCHTMSESHQRQLLLFADNSKKFMDEFSYDFQKEYLQILKRQFGTKRVNANRVYQEYISDKNHIHMNATRWVTLTGFVKYLGKTGKCIVDETEQGWFITYIDRDPETILKEEKKLKKQKMEKDDEERNYKFIEKQARLAQEKEALMGPKEEKKSELLRENEEETLKLDLKLPKKEAEKISNPLSSLKRKAETKPSSSKKTKEDWKKSALDEIREMEEKRREEKNRKDYWITEGIIVKIVTDSLGPDFYEKKGVIREVVNKYHAIVKVLDNGKKIKIDQEYLQTVIPAIGKTVEIVNGAYRGERATLLSLNVDKFSASLEIERGPLKGRKLEIPYEDFCKIDDSS
ncbi:DNA/RNA-binding protein KIN17 [Coccinella septempunctata]|uniref:DNA/RNA-binding protein KIN17 n=1 Tax=Coccinella septempunctata TaxID=41139 RepID=UPI001D091C6F|nr:DNA/RNA-binding protein KIN17 [Coccinella septempunctata]